MSLKPARFIQVGAALAAMSWTYDADAYKEDTHQDIADAAWEVMLATQDPALTTGRGLFMDRTTAPRSLRETPTNLSPAITTAEWEQFVAEIRATILKLNRLPSGLANSTNLGCNDVAPNHTMGRIRNRVGADYVGTSKIFTGDDNGPDPFDHCSLKPNGRFGIYARIGSDPGVARICTDSDPFSCEPFMSGSVCEDTDDNPKTPCADFGGLRGDFGDTIAQGLILGWHAKAGDDNVFDIDLDTNLAQAVIHWPLPWLGGFSISDAGSVFGFGLALLLAPFICIDAALNDESCFEAVARAARELNLATLLASAFPAFDSGNNGRLFSGLPHFINAQGPNALGLQTEEIYGFQNEWDDRRGIWYAWAGPDYFPGVVNRGIMTALDVTGQTIDPDESRMVERYSLGFENDGHPSSTRRPKWNFAREPLGHIPLTPADNFAFFGWERFRSNDNPERNVKFLRWPLHALGDISVPAHVVTTTGYGHVPYEETVNRQRLPFRNFEGFASPETEQLEQARRILHKAFFVRSELKSGVSIRDVVTSFAKETLASANSDGGWAWCDTCSISSLLGDDDARDYYENSNERRQRMRELFEQSIAHTLAFLMSAGDQPIGTRSCVEATEACATDFDCCVGSCTAGTCGGASAPMGPGTCTSSAQCPQNQPCVNGYCQGCADCVRDEQCAGGRCVNGCCASGPCGATGACTGTTICRSADCAGGMCDVSTGACCTQDFQFCDAQTNCCSGVCVIGQGQTTGTCERRGAIGTTCSLSSDCAPVGVCQNGTCVCGDGGSGCGTGTQCCSKQCVQGQCNSAGDPNDSCTTDAQCRVGHCVLGVCTTSCSLAAHCPNGTCNAGTCCLNDGADCTLPADCCSLNCAADGKCRAPVVR